MSEYLILYPLPCFVITQQVTWNVLRCKFRARLQQTDPHSPALALTTPAPYFITRYTISSKFIRHLFYRYRSCISQRKFQIDSEILIRIVPLHTIRYISTSVYRPDIQIRYIISLEYLFKVKISNFIHLFLFFYDLQKALQILQI